MKKFRLHPLFIPVALFFIMDGKALLLLYTLLTVLLHEYAHYLSPKNRGFSIRNLRLTPYGAVISADSGLPDKDAFFVSAAGPLFNLSFAVAIVALWWIFPSTYGFTLQLFKANLAIGIFNLLPLYPLDGSRMILSAVKNKEKCLKVLKIFSVSVAIVCLVLFVVSAFFTIAYPLFLVAFMLLCGVFTDGKEEKYTLIFNKAYYLKDCSKPLEKRELFVLPSLKIKRLLHELKNDAFYSVSVLDQNMKIQRVLNDDDLERMFFFDKNKTVNDFIQSTSK